MRRWTIDANNYRQINNHYIQFYFTAIPTIIAGYKV